MDRKFSLPLTKIVDFAKASDFRQRVKIVCGLYAPVPYFDNLWEGEGGVGGIIPLLSPSPPLWTRVNGEGRGGAINAHL